MADVSELEVKIGAMLSGVNKKKLKVAHDALADLGIGCGAPKSVDIDPADEGLVSFGGEIKALGGGKVGGYLVRFSDENTPDLTPHRDFFTKDTDFGEATEADGWFHHRGPIMLDGKQVYPAITRKFGSRVSLAKDDVGVFASAVLDLRDKYEKFVYDQIEARKIGWSSGTNTMERVPVADGKAHWIKTWVLGEDASYTPTPAEYRNSVTALKSLIPASGVADADSKTLPVQLDKEFEMAELDASVKSLVDAAIAEAFSKQAEATKAAELKAVELKAAEEAGYKKAMEEVKPLLRRAPAYVKQPGDDNDGVMAFKAWMKTDQVNDGLISPSADLLNIKAAFNVTTGASGGYMVPDPLYAQIIAKRSLRSWVRTAPTQHFTTNSDHLLVPVEDTASTAFVLTAEAAAYNENEATVAQIDMALLKYTKLTKVSEEFLAGENSNFDSWLVDSLARAEAITENTVATTAILASATAGTAAASQTALTIPEVERLIGTLGNGYNVQGETGFLMKNATKYYLRGVNFGSAQPWDFDGYPVHISDDMPAMTTGLRSTLFGNFNYFGVLERPGMLVQRNPWLYMLNGQVGIFANIYRAYAVLQATAFYTMAQA